MKVPVFAVIDTNVLVAGFLTKNLKSPTVKIIQAIINKDIFLIIHDEIMQEYIDVLSRPRFKLNLSKVRAFLDIIKSIGISELPTSYPEEMKDPKDRIFYEVSLTGNSYLVTGNQRHYPTTPKVVTPAQMLDILYN